MTLARSAEDPWEWWDQRRWVGILDRIEHRQSSVGLRFWGPPLWLEVMMSGPDSGVWSTSEGAGIEERSWDWQSLAACAGLAQLAQGGADDDRLLAVVSRYTIENLILNVTHEIGEWLRFDGQRIFPAHTTTSDSPAAIAAGGQGNGPVRVAVGFGAMSAHPSMPIRTGPAAAQLDLSRRIQAVAAVWRFTYLPGVHISYGPFGPAVIGSSSAEEAPTGWKTNWSSSTALAVATGTADELLQAVFQDVHGLLVRYEADRICRAFHVDGRQMWRLGRTDAPQALPSSSCQSREAEQLSVAVTYATEDGRPDMTACWP